MLVSAETITGAGDNTLTELLLLMLMMMLKLTDGDNAASNADALSQR